MIYSSIGIWMWFFCGKKKVQIYFPVCLPYVSKFACWSRILDGDINYDLLIRVAVLSFVKHLSVIVLDQKLDFQNSTSRSKMKFLLFFFFEGQRAYGPWQFSLNKNFFSQHITSNYMCQKVLERVLIPNSLIKSPWWISHFMSVFSCALPMVSLYVSVPVFYINVGTTEEQPNRFALM